MKNPVAATSALAAFTGKPVIAEDSNGLRYFKRLQLIENGIVVLESLDTSGEHGPVVLSLTTGAAHPALTAIWPVVGVLFELPA